MGATRSDFDRTARTLGFRLSKLPLRDANLIISEFCKAFKILNPAFSQTRFITCIRLNADMAKNDKDEEWCHDCGAARHNFDMCPLYDNRPPMKKEKK
jgi:hypothetical protein